MTLAFLVVLGTCALLIPVMLYVFWLKPSGWQWYDAALFGSMIASTDAVAIVAVLKKSAHMPFVDELIRVLGGCHRCAACCVPFPGSAAAGCSSEQPVPIFFVTQRVGCAFAGGGPEQLAAHPAGGRICWITCGHHVMRHSLRQVLVVWLNLGGGPERLRILLEGESLLNDASSITLFTIFIDFVIAAAEGHPETSGAGHIIGTIIKKMVWLAVGAQPAGKHSHPFLKQHNRQISNPKPAARATSSAPSSGRWCGWPLVRFEIINHQSKHPEQA